MIYKVTIKDLGAVDEWHAYFSGEFSGETIEEAIQKAREFYAESLDTTEEYILIKKVILIF